MKRILIIAIVALLSSCKVEKIKKVVTGKYVASDRYGDQNHTLYYSDGQLSVSGSYYYSTKIGDTILIDNITLK